LRECLQTARRRANADNGEGLAWRFSSFPLCGSGF
jgi:hypothetical protein